MRTKQQLDTFAKCIPSLQTLDNHPSPNSKGWVSWMKYRLTSMNSSHEMHTINQKSAKVATTWWRDIARQWPWPKFHTGKAATKIRLSANSWRMKIVKPWQRSIDWSFGIYMNLHHFQKARNWCLLSKFRTFIFFQQWNVFVGCTCSFGARSFPWWRPDRLGWNGHKSYI